MTMWLARLLQATRLRYVRKCLPATQSSFNGPDLGPTVFNSNGEGIYVNDDLKPEEGYNSEVGVTTMLRDLTIADDALQLSAKYFRSNIENYQQFMRTGSRPGRFGIDCETGWIGGDCQGMFNSDEDYKIDGVELAANYTTRDFGMGQPTHVLVAKAIRQAIVSHQ